MRLFSKFFALLLVLIFTVTTAAMPLSAAVSAPQKIKSLNGQLSQYLTVIELDGTEISSQELDSLHVQAGSELRIYLADPQGNSLFYDQNGDPIPTADVSLSKLRAARITLAPLDGDAADAVEKVEFAYAIKAKGLPTGAPYISVTFLSDLFRVDPIPFSFVLQLCQDGLPVSQGEVSVSGLLLTVEQDVTADDDTLDIHDGVVAVAVDDVSGIVLDLGDGLTMTANLTQGERYYGVAHLELEEPENAPTSAEIRKVYSLQTIHLDHPDNIVHIYSPVTLHVYTADGKYAGTTRDGLPCSDRYYLTNKKMDQLSI